MAKPTIDIGLGLVDIGQLTPRIAQLEHLGYEFRPQASFDERHHFLRRIENDERTHHLLVSQLPHSHWDEWITLRDYLRSNPEASRRYGAEKRRLAELYYDERGAYVEAKTTVVRELLAEASALRGQR